MKKITFRVILTAALAVFLGIGAYAGAGEKGHGHWSYEGEAGPNRWGELSPEFAVCSEGKNQSPVDIRGGAKGELKDLEFKYSDNPELDIENNGHTIKVDYREGSKVVVNGAEYGLVQFHFHSPSEHTLDGKYYDMELHLVHKNKEGKLAVVGVFMKKGEANAALDRILDNMPKKAGEKADVKAAFNASTLLPADRSAYYTYPGSLTTPPCTEGVTWLVLKNPIQLSDKQLAAYRKIMDNTNRPLQPLNERRILMKN
ncbi:MAG: carbonic anhydrase family protein [Deltaproteobacteria bacterium]|nr:carbonic anhydrase family protein [Deltaproteobacteria bacterium]